MVSTTTLQDKFRRHVVVALDVDTIEQAIAMSTVLMGRVDKFKIGSRLFTKYGPELLDRLGDLGVRVFLDLKFHDIPSVVGDACKNAAAHPAVFLMTVHASGGRTMMEHAVRGARASGTGSAKIIAVTALTSLSQSDLAGMGIDRSVDAWIEQLADTAMDAGVDGLVCSSQEVAWLRRRLGPSPLFVTPGIRLSLKPTDDDQVRVLTPAAALQAGSDLLVIGRPIYQAEDPIVAVDQITRSLSLLNTKS